MSGDDSAHWTQTRGVWGGIAVTSLDVRRVMEAAAARERRLSWVGRWLVRCLVRLVRLRTRVERWGRGRAGDTAGVARSQAEDRPPAL